MKTCQKCEQSKKDSEFPYRNQSKGTRGTTCKLCHREYGRLHYQNNIELYKIKARRNSDIYRAENREYVDNLKRSLGCKYCNEKEPVALDFHHLQDKDNEVSQMIKDYSLAAVKREIAKCVVICSNCHRKWHAGLIK